MFQRFFNFQASQTRRILRAIFHASFGNDFFEKFLEQEHLDFQSFRTYSLVLNFHQGEMARTKQPYGLSKQISLIRKVKISAYNSLILRLSIQKREIHRTASVGSYHDDKTGVVLEKVELENLQRSQTDFNRKLEAIQTRILTTISNYEEDRSLVNQEPF